MTDTNNRKLVPAAIFGLAGVAIILGTDGTLRYEPVKGLSSGTMTM